MTWLLLLFQAFELATGDDLFEPHSGEDYTRDEGTSIRLWYLRCNCGINVLFRTEP